jgi:hypothetical protein
VQAVGTVSAKPTLNSLNKLKSGVFFFLPLPVPLLSSAFYPSYPTRCWRAWRFFPLLLPPWHFSPLSCSLRCSRGQRWRLCPPCPQALSCPCRCRAAHAHAHMGPHRFISALRLHCRLLCPQQAPQTARAPPALRTPHMGSQRSLRALQLCRMAPAAAHCSSPHLAYPPLVLAVELLRPPAALQAVGLGQH